MTKTRLLVLAATLLAAAAVPAQDRSEERRDPSDGLSAAIALQQHFGRLAARSYQTVVTVTGYQKAVQPVMMLQPTEAAANPVDELQEEGWAAATDEDLYPGYRPTGVATGFVVQADGEILTCLHALQKPDGTFADLIDVQTHDLRHTICELSAAEPTLNIALLRMVTMSAEHPPKFEVAEFGDSVAALPGHYAIGVGDPSGPEQYFGVGYVTSPPSRDCYQENMTATYLQASLRVHPECYGGPLLNVRGEVIGILLPLRSRFGALPIEPARGLEFALPSNVLSGLYNSLRQVGSARSPWLGFAVMSRAELLKDKGPEAFAAMPKPRFGIYIENVFSPSPAAASGLQPGDFLVKFDGEYVQSPILFQRFLYLAGIGADVTLEIHRDGETFERRLRVEERPKSATQR